jgi:hypothetical protein
MKPIIDWCAEHPLLLAYVALGVAGAVGRAKFTSPRLQAVATLLGAIGLGVHDAIQLATTRNQDAVPTVPELPKSGDE